MENNQAKLLKALAKKLRGEKKTKEEILKSFVSAGILGWDSKFTENYPNLRRITELNRESNVS
jgi:hypothetical protein